MRIVNVDAAHIGGVVVLTGFQAHEPVYEVKPLVELLREAAEEAQKQDAPQQEAT